MHQQYDTSYFFAFKPVFAFFSDFFDFLSDQWRKCIKKFIMHNLSKGV